MHAQRSVLDDCSAKGWGCVAGLCETIKRPLL